ncbi:MAG: hypothetical protein VB138_06260 [Burkholderia sp.]
MSQAIDFIEFTGASYPPPQGQALHRRLGVIRQEANDMSAQHGGGLTADE